jgi:DNA-binding response OmpR family regulator
MKTKIMVVDDEPDIQDSLKVILERQDYEVVTVSSGKECLKKIEEGFKGIVLMDIMMPGMTGWDTIKEIVERNYAKDVEIEIISALGVKENKNMGNLEPYVYDYLNKPIEIKELVESVKKCSAYFYAKNSENAF